MMLCPLPLSKGCFYKHPELSIPIAQARGFPLSFVKQLLEKLENLTESMDVPVFRRQDVFWLNKHLEERNSNHKHFQEASQIIEELLKMGVR